jgi:hypothetical protein
MRNKRGKQDDWNEVINTNESRAKRNMDKVDNIGQMAKEVRQMAAVLYGKGGPPNVNGTRGQKRHGKYDQKTRQQQC